MITIINGYVYRDSITYLKTVRAYDNDNKWTKEAKRKLWFSIFRSKK